ncbi:hypothetical protein D3C78_1779110 [compost metagenome]
MAADHGRDGAHMFVERIDARQIALAGHHEQAAHAMVAQLLHQDLAPIAHGQLGRGRSFEEGQFTHGMAKYWGVIR